MRSTLLVFAIILSLLSGCATKPLPPVAVNIPTRTIHYLAEVKPLLEKRCTVCHSCYNSPCQLKLDSYEGADRGATKKAVYNSSRLKTMDPTRLFTDAKNTTEWRKKGFFSVTESTVSDGFNDSMMLQLLDHKRKNPKSSGSYYPEADDLTCSENGSELAEYLEKHPNNGMPFGFPPLKQEEFDLVAGWLYQGAKGPTPAEQRVLEASKPEDAAEVRKWETFFNRDDPKHAMTARYIYEHLFLAHIKFGTSTNEFFELVRSRTPPGAPIDLVATVRPYDDPGVPAVYYRFRKIHSTIVQKTHMVYELDDARMRRFEELFIEPEWLQEPHLVGIRSQDQRQSVQGIRTDPSTLKVHVPSGQRPLRHHDLHPRPRLQGPDRPECHRRSLLGHVPGPGSRPFRALSRLPEVSRRQARHADRDGERPRAVLRPDERAQEARDRVLQGPAGLLCGVELRRARLRLDLEGEPRIRRAVSDGLPSF